MATSAALPTSDQPLQPDGTDVNTSQPNTKKRRSRPSKESGIITTFTISHPPWTYLHLRHLIPSHHSQTTSSPLDAVTAHLHLNAALAQFLGLHGSAIPVDLLKLESREVWIRVPGEDRTAVIAALGGWAGRGGEGWAVMGWSSWDARAEGRDGGRDLFDG